MRADRRGGLATSVSETGLVMRTPAAADEAGPVTPSPGGARALLQDGGSLSIAVGLLSALGAVAWVIAARVASPETVGRASALVSAMLFASSVGQASLGTAIFVWLPVARGLSRTLVRRVIATVLVMSLVVTGLLMPLVHLVGLRNNELALFVVASLSWALYQLLGPLQAALGRSRFVPAQDGAFSVLRLALIPVLGGLGVVGIVSAFVLPAVLFGVVITVWMWRRLPPPGPGTLPEVRSALRFTGGNWAGSIAQLVGWHVVPLLVTAVVGPAIGAVFYVLWTLCSSVELAVQQFGGSVLVRSSTTPGVLAHDVRVTLRLILMVAVPALALVGLAAEPLLSLFGPHYVAVGVIPLRLLVLGLVGRLVVIVAVVSVQAQGKSSLAFAAHTTHSAAVLVGVVLASRATSGNQAVVIVSAAYGIGAWVSAIPAGAVLSSFVRRRPRGASAPAVRGETP
jgi:O-antigen/teichoic acid export membrane protein